MSDNTNIIPKIISFQWDSGNNTKNSIKHKVTKQEAEQVFLNDPLIISSDVKHSQQEKRYQGLGKTDDNRFLFVAFTIRDKQVRIISIRNQNKQERHYYETA